MQVVVPIEGQVDTAYQRLIPESWLSEYSIGVFEIDAQHKKLFDAKNYDGAEQVIGGCVDYTKYHFKTEEGLMKKVQYPYLSTQVAEHHTFTDQCMQTAFRMDWGDTESLGRFTDFLLSWLVNHIKSSDKDFGTWLHAPEQSAALQRLIDEGVMVYAP
eukprot:m51a1_g1315 hypothetical protein (158) ;mRNA; f:224464-225200